MNRSERGRVRVRERIIEGLERTGKTEKVKG